MDGPQTEAAAVTAFLPSLPTLSRILLSPEGAEAGSQGGDSTGAAPAQPQGEVKVPEGKAFVDAQEYETLRRNNERLRGMDEFYRSATKHGFKSPKDFEPIGKFTAALKERGMSLEQLSQAFLTEKEQEGVDTEAMSPKALQSLFEKWATEQGFVKSADLDQREQKIHALSAHKESMAKESSAVDSFVKGLLGDTATDRDKRLLALYVKDTLESRRNVYPEGHPLHESELSAFDEKGLAPVFEEVKKFWAVGQGEEMAQAGDAALKGKVPSPAGAPPKAPSKPSKEVEMRPGGRFPVSTIEAAAAKKQAARGGKPISSIGG
jgi:hypothetical protein